MKIKPFTISVRFGGRTKKIIQSSKDIKYSKGKPYGLASYSGSHCNVWIYSNQTKYQLANTFFHEMGHVFLQMVQGLKRQKRKEEVTCSWIGYIGGKLILDGKYK